ncbi:MAG: carotenoid 1,2-hydratase [Burkholderiales bacterium]|nr:carotenoid 1,2-hydratase [Burkholderiales bacterium]
MLSRRGLVLALLAAGGPGAARAAGPSTVAPDLAFPRDFGAHPEARIEWWYLTGALAAAGRTWGFQITFFRAATGIAGAEASAFRAGELVFAHAAVTDLANRRLLHDQRIARSGFGIAAAASTDTALVLRDWRLERSAIASDRSRYRARAASQTAGFRFDLGLEATQPLLLQGERGLSRKGPDTAHFSRYYSEPQLAVNGTLALGADAPLAVAGRAWLDHEWSNALLAPEAIGWDWIGMNLDDGGALTAFRLRRRDGTTLWAGGSHRPARGQLRDFAPSEVAFAAGRHWTSAASKAVYPVEWTVTTPAGAFTVKAMQDDQELDSRASTGSIYWEGLSALVDASGRTVGRGYLEMTGYATPLRL